MCLFKILWLQSWTKYLETFSLLPQYFFTTNEMELELELELFNIFLCDLFFIMDDIDFASYADDNKLYGTIGSDIEDVIFKL